MARSSDAPERLLAAALDLIWTSSYGAVGVDDICERAGVKKGSFYHFFPSKADLALAAYEEHWKRRQPEYDRIFSPQIAPLERLIGWCRLIYNNQTALFERHGFVCGCPYSNIGSELGTQDERLRAKSEQLMQRTLTYVESAVRDLASEGMLRVDHVHFTARAIYSCVLGQILMAKVANEPTLLSDLDQITLRQLGFKPAPPAAAA